VACDPLVDLSLAPSLDFWILSQGIDRKGEGVGSSVHSCQELNLEIRGGRESNQLRRRWRSLRSCASVQYQEDHRS
jgi:hypothetical protein